MRVNSFGYGLILHYTNISNLFHVSVRWHIREPCEARSPKKESSGIANQPLAKRIRRMSKKNSSSHREPQVLRGVCESRYEAVFASLCSCFLAGGPSTWFSGELWHVVSNSPREMKITVVQGYVGLHMPVPLQRFRWKGMFSNIVLILHTYVKVTSHFKAKMGGREGTCHPLFPKEVDYGVWTF